jgi:hypothetical protein
VGDSGSAAAEKQREVAGSSVALSPLGFPAVSPRRLMLSLGLGVVLVAMLRGTLLLGVIFFSADTKESPSTSLGSLRRQAGQ